MIDNAQTQEMSNTQLQSMAPEENNFNTLGERRETKQKYKHDRENQRNKHQNNKQGYRQIKQLCSKCSIKHKQNRCSAKRKICANCKKHNHFAGVCKSKLQERKRDIHGVEKDESSDDHLC